MLVYEKTCSGKAAPTYYFFNPQEDSLIQDSDGWGHGENVLLWQDEVNCWIGNTVPNSHGEGYGMGKNLHRKVDEVSQSPHHIPTLDACFDSRK